MTTEIPEKYTVGIGIRIFPALDFVLYAVGSWIRMNTYTRYFSSPRLREQNDKRGFMVAVIVT